MWLNPLEYDMLTFIVEGRLERARLERHTLTFMQRWGYSYLDARERASRYIRFADYCKAKEESEW